MLNFTNKQQLAIDTKGNVLVSAAAGSGKTRVMTERICRLLASGDAELSEISVLTFTEAAAAEMKSRIYLRLLELSTQTDDQDIDDIQSERMGIMAENVLNADISTVHSFCKNVIDKNYFKLSLSPAFTIASDVEANRLLNKSFSLVLEQRLNDKHDDTLSLYRMFGKRTGESVKKIILSMYKELVVLPEPETYRHEVLDQYETSDYKKTIQSIFEEKVRSNILCAIETLNSTREIALKCDYNKTAELLIGYIDEIKHNLKIFDTQSYEDYLRQTCFSKMFRIEPMDEDIKNFFVKNRDLAKEYISLSKNETCLLDFDNKIKSESTQVRKIVEIMLSVVFELKEQYMELKTQANVLDFNDLEHFAYEIMKKPDYMSSYKYVFIDEYQDINQLQEAILNCVKREENLFMVGDIKQSIYGFRHAMPDIFLKKQQAFLEIDNKDDITINNLIRMNENFRSSKTVVSAINTIMSDILTTEFGGLNYTQSEKLVHRENADLGACELIIVDEDGDFCECEDNTHILSSTEAQAYTVAYKIKQLISTDIEMDQGKKKSIQYSDIVVLLREIKNSGMIYKRVFDRAGIPCECDVKADEMSPYIKVYNNLLKVANNPIDDIALLSVIRFEYFGITCDDWITISKNQSDNISIYHRLCNYQEKNSDVLSQKIQAFFGFMEDIRQKSRLMPKKVFLKYCMTKAHFTEIVCAHSNVAIDQLITYIEMLCDQTPKTTSLARIVRFIKDNEKNGQNLDIKTSAKSQNCVKIMTIHKSKGLEFPIVIIGSLDKTLNRSNTMNISMEKTLGIGIKRIDPEKNLRKSDIIHHAINDYKQKKDLLESVRLLYVAMTRAEHSLIMIGAQKGLKKSFSKWLSSGQQRVSKSQSFLDMIVPSIIAKDAFVEHFCISNFMPPAINRYEDIKVKIAPKRIDKLEYSTDVIKTFESFMQIKKNNLHIGYQYPYENLLDIPSKKSVSNLYTSETKYLNTQKQQIITQCDNEDPVISAATKGTAFHVFMQHLDFYSKSVQDIVNQKDLMVEKKILNEKEASTIPVEKVYDLLCSEVFERVRKATVCYREKSFTFKANSKDLGFDVGEYILIQGTIDCCFLEDDGYVIIDYKTDKTVTKQKIEKYTKQLNYYSQALEKIMNYKVKQRYIYFINEKFYSV